MINNEIVAWQLSKRNDDQLVLDTRNSERKKETSRKLYSIRMKAPIHVSGVQHTIRSIRREGSYYRKATCLDNAYIEPFFSHLKTEKLYLKL